MAVRVNAEQIRHAERALAGLRGGARLAAARAVNRALDGARADAAKQAADEYHVKQKDVRETIEFTKATAANPAARLVSRGKSIPLIRYQVRPNKPQPGARPVLRVAVLRAGGLKPLRGAFVANSAKTGAPNVFERIGKDRYPIKKLYGPAIPQMLGAKRVRDVIERNAEARIEKRFEHEIERLLRAGK